MVNLIRLIGIATCMLFLPISAVASEIIRVVIADDQKSATLVSPQGFMGGKPVKGKKIVYGMRSLGNKPVRIRSAGNFTGVNSKKYRGWVELRKKTNGRLLIINELDIEDYLKGVIASEIPNDWEFEALKAQAIAARTYAIYQKRVSGKRLYHIKATVSSQVYNGRDGERTNTVRAVEDTTGIVIEFRGDVIPAFFHSSCGGHTEDASSLWGIEEPYLRGVDCECQSIVQNGLWEKRLSMSFIEQAIRKMGHGAGSISDMSISSVTTAGRVKEVAVRSSGRTAMIPAEMLRAALGTTTIPSVFFELEMAEGEAVFSGRGSGHGVGLCQWGTKEMAQRGFDYKAILSHYYPGTTLARLK